MGQGEEERNENRRIGRRQGGLYLPLQRLFYGCVGVACGAKASRKTLFMLTEKDGFFRFITR